MALLKKQKTSNSYGSRPTTGKNPVSGGKGVKLHKTGGDYNLKSSSQPKGKSLGYNTMASHESREKSVMGAGYAAHERSFHGGAAHQVGGGKSPLRNSGVKGAHRIGGK